MKRILNCLLIVVAIIVIYNARNRIGAPTVDFDNALPFLAGHDTIQSLFAAFLKPGTAALWYLGLSANSPFLLFIDFFTSWHVWLICLRCVFFYVGRRLGVVPITWFAAWTKLAFPWRFFYRRYLKFARWRSQRKYYHGPSGSWMSSSGAANRIYLGGDQVPLGRIWLD